MYKSLSEAMQERQRRNIEFARKNTAGIDETVWANDAEKINAGVIDDPQDERVRLLGLKIEFQTKVRKFTEKIGWAERNFRRTGRRDPEYEQYERERSSHLDSIARLEAKLAAVKVKIKKQADEKEEARQQARLGIVQPTTDGETLADIFMEMAKEMLADPVYKRVMIAAVHRLQEHKGQ